MTVYAAACLVLALVFLGRVALGPRGDRYRRTALLGASVGLLVLSFFLRGPLSPAEALVGAAAAGVHLLVGLRSWRSR